MNTKKGVIGYLVLSFIFIVLGFVYYFVTDISLYLLLSLMGLLMFFYGLYRFKNLVKSKRED